MQVTTRTRWVRIGSLAGVLAALVSLGVSALVSDVSLPTVIPGIVWYFAVAAISGAVYGWLMSKADHLLSLLENVTFGIVYAVLVWVVFGLVIIPMMAGQGFQWQAAAITAQIPLLMLFLLQGVCLSLTMQSFAAVGILRQPALHIPIESDEPGITQRVVILGGGFAGVTAAQHLEKLFGEDQRVQITLVSRINHLLFTPMLAEVTAGGVEAQHISPPLRAFFRRIHVIQGEPVQINPTEKVVTVRSGALEMQQYQYDQLVLALGAVPNFYGNANIERHAFTFKSLSDAIRIRNHVIDILERADTEPDPVRRQTLLTFVVVGAGFAGTELIGGLNDFVRGSSWYYKKISNDEIKMLLVHPGEVILPELSADLARYAEKKMVARGVSILGGVRATDASATSVTLGAENIATSTLIWTAGSVPSPLLRACGFETDKRGAVVTDEYLLVKGYRDIWAVGDCAAIPDLITGKNAPPTAQYALREAKTVAYNVHAALNQGSFKAFRHRTQGALAVVGHQTACAEVFGFKFSGLFAWLLWRGIYLLKLPTLEKKLRVLLDWMIDVFFPRDIAYAQQLDEVVERTPVTGD